MRLEHTDVSYGLGMAPAVPRSIRTDRVLLRAAMAAPERDALLLLLGHLLLPICGIYLSHNFLDSGLLVDLHAVMSETKNGAVKSSPRHAF